MTIKELIEWRQGYNKSFDDFMEAMRSLQFKLKSKILEDNFVGILKENLNSQMGAC